MWTLAESGLAARPSSVRAVSLIHIDRPWPEDLSAGDHELCGPDDGRLADAEACIAGGRAWDGAMFDRAPKVKIVARAGIGYDAVDLNEASRRGVMVVNTPDGPTVSTAEHTIGLMFAVAKTIATSQRELREAAGGYHPRSKAVELDGLTLGLFAYGRIGRRVARMAAGIGMSVIAHDPFLTSADDVELVDFDTLLSRSDVLSLHAPLTQETTHLFNDEVLARCRPGVILLNAARGGLVDHDALLRALDSGQVMAAGLDVTEPEPLDAEHPLLRRENVVVTPHVASATAVSRRRMLDMAMEQVLMALAGDRPTELLNPDALEN